jgi:hypothetical protein
MSLDLKIEKRVLHLLPQWIQNPTDFLDDYFTDWYLEPIDLSNTERNYMNDFLEEKGYFIKSQRKRFDKYVWLHHNPDVQAELSLIRKVPVEGNNGEHDQG